MKESLKARKPMLIIIIFLRLVMTEVSLSAQENKLWYKKPASVWTEALPLGNGRLGAMVFGRVQDELIQLNESTLWTGGPVSKETNQGAFSNLAEVRKALFKADYALADTLERKMQGPYSQSYLPLADLHIHQSFQGASASAYYRDLDLDKAIATIRYKVKGITYIREQFCSAAGQVIIIRITSSQPRKITLDLSTSSQLNYKRTALPGGILALNGKAPAHLDPNYVHYTQQPVQYEKDSCKGMRFALMTRAATADGRIRTDTSGIHIKNASSVTIFLSAATSFHGYALCPDRDENAAALGPLLKAGTKTYAKLKAAHLNDYQHFFSRVSLSLNKNTGSRTDLPTDERLAAYTRGGRDPGLEALYFQYGRYLLISSSRTPGVPANLQGIWNKELRAPWSSNYTSNINVQMNYWLAEECNLTEMHQPLLDFIRELSITGKEVARNYYHASGWVTHHNTDIWAMAGPVGDFGHGEPKWANWPMGGDWLCRHLWEHYLYTGDKVFLSNIAYPVMKDAARFTFDWLVADSNGHLVTAPSMSPENEFIYGPGKVGDVSVSSTMDLGIIRDLFDNLSQASRVLGIDARFRDSLQEKQSRLLPFQTGSKGQLQEWYKDQESPDPHHRHVSHLFALYPANEISPFSTPALAAAAKRSLELRGDDGTGWSLAWKVNLWARLLDGNHAYTLFRNLLRLTRENETHYNGGGGVYPNLFDAHPPFQIDGNFGGTAGITEMLLQSQGGLIQLIPAIPDAWETGSVKGLVARGGFVIGMDWAGKKILKAEIYSRNGGDCRILSTSPLVVKNSSLHAVRSNKGYELTLPARKGMRYTLLAGKD